MKSTFEGAFMRACFPATRPARRALASVAIRHTGLPFVQTSVRSFRMAVRALALVLVAFTASCASTGDGFWSRHTSGEMWTRGAHEFLDTPGQWVAPAVLAGVSPLAWIGDGDTAEDSVSQQVFNSNTKYGDDLALGYLILPTAIGGWQAFGGDARLVETSLESIAYTMAATYALKSVINRERPDGSSEDSFPSGHTSAAFAGATLLHREIGRRFDHPWWSWAVYLPASYVGISRMEGERHYLADVLFGAALAMTITNVTWNAHFGASTSETTASLAPVVGPGRVGLGFSFSF